jgi:hypothetical protein
MSWVGPANWAKLNPRKGWAGLISTQQYFFSFFFVWARSDLDIWARTGLDICMQNGLLSGSGHEIHLYL